MSAVIEALKEEIVEKLDDLSQKDIRELYDFVSFLELKEYLPEIDPSQAYFWTKKWQNMEKAATEDIKKGKIRGPFKSTKALVKDLKK